MVFAKERTQVICEQLKKMSKVQKVSLDQWQMKEGNFLYPRNKEAGGKT